MIRVQYTHKYMGLLIFVHAIRYFLFIGIGFVIATILFSNILEEQGNYLLHNGLVLLVLVYCIMFLYHQYMVIWPHGVM